MFAENLERGDINFAGRATVTMVGLDDSGKPVDVPQLKVESEEDKKLFQAALKRYEERSKRVSHMKKQEKEQQELGK